MLHLILYCPEIPQNTGNVGRTAAITKARLHLIEPLGFELSEKHLKRSGMDYWDKLDLCVHKNWTDFLNCPKAPKRLWLFTTKSDRSYWDADFQDEDGLVFGNEGHGAPAWLHEKIGAENRITIPHSNNILRSLNLATSVGIACYEALRQMK
ncbi:MAG: tRNA (cytidine(34)-2'-O)-methyltransferase [Verrucomicrobia bacterium]|nr:tRNA (cytidine(34)-2'-O)-methyltransferase [Verrucomicrobiota bacterium]MDA1066638.1 tRNA (cytidine(34)-2'-O)-methyltransferase [Verrucomicrobiota bacterium]